MQDKLNYYSLSGVTLDCQTLLFLFQKTEKNFWSLILESPHFFLPLLLNANLLHSELLVMFLGSRQFVHVGLLVQSSLWAPNGCWACSPWPFTPQQVTFNRRQEKASLCPLIATKKGVFGPLRLFSVTLSIPLSALISCFVSLCFHLCCF